MSEANTKSSAQAPPAPLPRGGGRSLVCLALVLMFVAAIFANVTFGELKKASNYDKWQKATATVVECVNERDGIFAFGIGRKYQKVTCQFNTAGRIIRSHFRSDGWKYHQDQTVEMRFDPFAPQYSMAGPSTTAQIALWGSIGFAVCFILGASLLVYALKRLR